MVLKRLLTLGVLESIELQKESTTETGTECQGSDLLHLLSYNPSPLKWTYRCRNCEDDSKSQFELPVFYALELHFSKRRNLYFIYLEKSIFCLFRVILLMCQACTSKSKTNSFTTNQTSPPDIPISVHNIHFLVIKSETWKAFII